MLDRTTSVEKICNHLRANLPTFNLVRPYNGELDRFSKLQQLKSVTFPAEVNLTTPFALVISKDRFRWPREQQNRNRQMKHEISIYIGDANTHMIGSTDVPNVLFLLDQCRKVLDGKVLVPGAGELTIESDGQYLITTDLFTVYEQHYFQFEIAN